MKDEIRRIMKLVQEGKLSPEDAAELIEAFSDSTPEEETVKAEAPSEGGSTSGSSGSSGSAGSAGSEGQATASEKKARDAFGSFIDEVERIGKGVATSVNWQDVAKQVREGITKGVDALKQAADEAKKTGTFNIFFVTETKKVELPLSVPEGKVLRVEGFAGDIRVVGGSEEGKLTATAKFRGSTHEEAKSKAENYVPVLEESDKYVILKQPVTEDFSVDLVIEVLKGVPVELKVQSGDVLVEGTGSSCRVEGKSGDVTLRGLEGAVAVTLSSGDVCIEDAEASFLTVESKSGDVSLRNVSGAVNVRTASGDISAKACRARNLSVEVPSGDVSVDMVEPVQGTISIRTMNGDVSLSVPDGSDCRVSLSTINGDASCEIELIDENKEGQRVTGRLGDGNGTLDVTSVNGDISLQLSLLSGE